MDLLCFVAKLIVLVWFEFVVFGLISCLLKLFALFCLWVVDGVWLATC